MKHHSTSNVLVQYLYGETSVLRKLEVENAIQEDQSINRSYETLRKGYKLLPKVSFYPSDDVLDAVVNYSKRPVLNYN